MSRKRYVQVGTGGRSHMYLDALMKDYAAYGELVGLCDVNQARMDFYNRLFQTDYNHDPVPTYKAHEFDRMIAECKPDCVIVTSIDRTHHRYICRAMELGCDAITEKPMTIDAEKCQQIIDTIKRTGKRLTVTFNYRYAPMNAKIKEVMQSGIVGEVLSIHYEWPLDTSHGADYFRRWHRDKRNSGGLLVHKATHHFDLINWWIDSSPELVYALGDLRFYGRENAERRGVTEFYARVRNAPAAANDPFALRSDYEQDRFSRGLYWDAEAEDGYYRDQSVFGDGISIEDTVSLVVRYRNKATMTYSLVAYASWEGFRLAINGSKGRLEVNMIEGSPIRDVPVVDVPGGAELEEDPRRKLPRILFQPHFRKPIAIEYEAAKGGHGGGDARLLRDLFIGGQQDPLRRAAGYIDGVHSIMTGIAGNESMKTGRPVLIDDLITL